MENNKKISFEEMRGGLLIKNKTKKGYLIAHLYDGIDISKRMIYHRGTVQKGIAQTITTQISVGVVVLDER